MVTYAPEYMVLQSFSTKRKLNESVDSCMQFAIKYNTQSYKTFNDLYYQCEVGFWHSVYSRGRADASSLLMIGQDFANDLPPSNNDHGKSMFTKCANSLNRNIAHDGANMFNVWNAVRRIELPFFISMEQTLLPTSCSLSCTMTP